MSEPVLAIPRLPTVEIAVHIDATVNYASYQNHVPLVRSLVLTNVGTEPLVDIEIVVHCEPAFTDTIRLRFERLEIQETRIISALDLKFQHRYLAELNEAERGRVSVQVTASGVEIAQTDYAVDILAYDQWAGTRGLPELLAAFSMPNHPAIDRLIANGSELLRRSGGTQMMNGYQSKNRDDVWAQVSAIYSIVGAAGLHYSEPPASFGTDGQKIRTPERILSGGVATCLDLAMLLVACIEQAGLNPVVLIKKGHAWAGCWLVNTTFPTPVFDDGQAVRKRVESGELLVFETTGCTHRPLTTLRIARELGLDHLREESEFLFAVDIKRARIEQIRPLPARGEGASVTDPISSTPAAPAVEQVPVLPPLDTDPVLIDEEIRPETPAGRLARWKAKLLDLTLRNKLINFKPTNMMLPLRVPDTGHLENALADGHEWKFRPLPPIMQGDDPRVAAVAARRTGTDPIESLARKAFGERELLAAVDAITLDARLYDIFSAARLGLEEGGANTLYLALGFLRWTEDERAEKSHLAPLLLVPITLNRQSVRTGYSIKRHDDETIINPTLMQLLRENFQMTFKELDPLPADDSGIDVAKVWQIFRLAVKEIPRWEVIEDVYLGIFSFTKYLMWKDLQDRTKQLTQNRVVKHLIECPSESMGRGKELLQREDLDDRHPPETLLTPLLADSSQLNAVSRASAGHDFAIEGPPGTGKSQTITNLIAHFLGQGRTVLFVSEKMAALDVVHRRLSAIGLDPYCLELHSAKARKPEVLQQLRIAIDAAAKFSVPDWQREAQRLGALRSDLNRFVRVLHRPYENGLTAHRAMETAVQNRHWSPAAMPWTQPDTHDRVALDQLRELCGTIQAVAGEINDVGDTNPLAVIHRAEWSNAWQAQLLKEAATLELATLRTQKAATAIGTLLGLPLQAPSGALLNAIDQLAEMLLQATQVPARFVSHAAVPAVRARLQLLRSHGEQRQTNWTNLATQFKPEIAMANGKDLIETWRAACVTWWPKRWFGQRAITGQLLRYSVSSSRPRSEEIPQFLEALIVLNDEDRMLASSDAELTEWLGSTYQGAGTDWSAVARLEEWGKRFEVAIQRVARFMEQTDPVRLGDQIKQQLRIDATFAGLPADVIAQLVEFRDTWTEFRNLIESVAQNSGSGHAFVGDLAVPGLPSRLRAIVSKWRNGQQGLRLWCRWRKLRGEAITAGLASVVQALETGDLAPSDVQAFTEFSYQNWWLKAMIDREPALRDFSSADHNRKIELFRVADERFQKLTEKYITAVLAGKVPQSAAGQKPDAEMGLVLRELNKQRAHMPIRKLVQGIPTLLPKLKPCLLMSPLSVAQYLDASHASFDVVVFDEASQIPVWDAVGAIARGKQLIVVGDPKQLPPTNFFNRADDDEMNGDMAEAQPVKDLESILDECLGAGLPTLRLEWHYRSRHESLITFSNHRYYDSRLITFPSPVTKDMAVKLRLVSGIYDRGATRTNRVEAGAIVAEIVAHFTDENRRKQTIGVVTFNQTQQRLIETLLDEELRKAPQLEQHMNEHGPEKLFIKNLENVQGDERDVILFSVTYGKDAAGRMAMNFGPLNQEGGHRRLNVAITRARVGVTIFSSIRPEEIELSRTRAAGVTDLKNYLEFAQKGPRALLAQSVPTGLEPESPFEIEVIQALRDKGWTVHPQVGCSGYRLDMAIVHPSEPGRYILGVECDGATYHSLPTARDRDRLRQHVLEGLGWSLHRIWSTDWWTHPAREIEKLDAALKLRLAKVEAECVRQ